MYVGVLSILLGEAVVFEASVLFEYAGSGVPGALALVLINEEPALRSKFGTSYKQYCRTVPRWIPRARRSIGSSRSIVCLPVRANERRQQ